MELMLVNSEQVGESIPSTKDITIPTIIKDKVLLSPGKWNGYLFTAEDIIRGYQNTDWSDKKNFELIKDHSKSVDAFVGYVRNIRVTPDGKLIGDLELWDEKIIRDLVVLKAKFGISARVLGYEEGERFRIQSFNNFSIVSDPACKEAYINLSNKKLKEINVVSNFVENYELKLSDETTSSVSSGSEISDANSNQKIKYGKKKKDEEEKEEELKKVTNFEEIRKRLGMSVDEFYAIPRDPPSASKLPIFDAAHVRNAIARFNQVKGVSEAEKKKAWAKIKKAAKKFGIKISVEHSDHIYSSSLEDNDYRAERRSPEQLKMAEEEQIKQSSESVNENDSAVEESNAESASSSEELSSKLDLILSQLQELSERVAKLEDSPSEQQPEEPKEEEKEEEPKEEESKEESAENKELAELKKQVEELSAKLNEPKPMSVVETKKVDKTVGGLLGKTYSPAEQRLAEVLLQNAEGA